MEGGGGGAWAGCLAHIVSVPRKTLRPGMR